MCKEQDNDVCAKKPDAYAEAASALRQDGFTVVRSCVDGDVLRTLAEKYEREILPQKHACDVRREAHGVLGADGLPRVVHVSNMCEMPELARLAADPRLLKLASACLGGGGVRPVQNLELFDKPPDGNQSTATPPHQDNFYFKAKTPGIALWITLDEMDSASGTVQYVRGSHLRGLRFHEFDFGPTGGFAKQLEDFTDEDDELLTDPGHLYPGDVVVHHGLTIHYAPANQTSKRRRGLVVNYVAEQIAYTLCDDLHMPSLNFHVHQSGRLVAALKGVKGWADRRVLASTTVQCALAGWCSIKGGIQSKIWIEEDTGELFVEISDSFLQRQAIIALVQSGHVVHGIGDIGGSTPLLLGTVKVPAPPPSSLDTRLPDKYLGVWMLNGNDGRSASKAESAEFALRLQTLSGLYVDIRVPSSIMKMKCMDKINDDDNEDEDSFNKPETIAEQNSSAGWLCVHGDHQDTAVKHRCIAFQPFNGMVDVAAVRWCGANGRTLVEESVASYPFDCKETWVRVDEPLEPNNVAILELVDDEHGRRGFWVVIGSWFGRVIGRGSKDILSDVVCRSLSHAMKAYGDEWELDPERAVHEYDARFGRVESPGVFRVVHDLDASHEGELLLDDCKRQLRRDAVCDDIIVETWSNRRWKIRELPSKFEAFGKLKRMMA